MIMTRIFAVILVVFSIISLSSDLWAQELFKVEIVEIDDRKAVLATVQSVDVTPARARIGGTVGDLFVDEGSNVIKGDVIARISDEKIHLALQTLQARTASLQSERKLAEIGLNRAQRLRKSGAGSQAKLDDARTHLDVVVKNLKVIETEKDLVLQREREGAVLAPATGRILRVKVTNGVVVMPGEEIASLAAKTYILRIEVPERHARFIASGDSVLVGARGMLGDEGQGNVRTGIVRLVYPEMIKGRVVADVNVGGLGDFFIGERITVFVTTGTRKTFLVPKAFIYNRYGLHYVRLENNTEVVIQPGRPFEGAREVLSGLRVGDVLLKPERG